jgi:hypothetical protein
MLISLVGKFAYWEDQSLIGTFPNKLKEFGRCADCGMRNADCGLESKLMLLNPQSEIRIPQSV